MRNVASWDSAIKGLSKPKSIAYPVFVCCDLFFWLHVYRVTLKNVRAFSFPGRSEAQYCPPAALPLPALKLKGSRRNRETIRPGTRGGSVPLGPQGWSQHTAATPVLHLPPLLPAQAPLPCPTKLFCPQLIYSPWGQRFCPVACNKAGFIVHLSSTLQFSLSPWQPYSIP